MNLQSELKTLICCLFFIIDLLVLYPLFAFLKWNILTNLGMSYRERTAVFSNRKSNFTLNKLIDKYGDRNLRIADGIPRKLLHITSGLLQLLLVNLVIQDTYKALQIIVVYQLILIVLSMISYSSNKIIGLAGLIYGASSRIRDGIDGRKNIFIVRFSSINLFCLMFIEQIAKSKIDNKFDFTFFTFFVFLPLTIGDALGEIIGTTWGKQKLRVWGIGQINRKSWLGTISVFLGSLLPLLLIVNLNNLSWQWWLLSLVIALTTTAIELIAPRSTDNFFIPIANGLVCLTFAVNFIP